MLIHLVRITLIVLVIALLIVYPFLAGSYDSLAMPLSLLAQAFGVLGLLLVPVGVAWLMAEGRQRRRPVEGRGFAFAVVAAALGTLIAVALTVIALATVGRSLALVLLAGWLYGLYRLVPILRAMRHAERDQVNPAPLYLVLIPLAALIVQLLAAPSLTAASRARAIAGSAEMIAHIEAYRGAQGRYPSSLLGVWKDYDPHVVGVERYHYRPEGDAYNLYFEQPRFLLDRFGTREFVVYNPRDAHLMVSHPSAMLLLTPAQWRSYGGWYAAHDLGPGHWRSFWFD